MDNSEALKIILDKLDGLEKGQQTLKKGQSELRTDVSGLKSDMSMLKNDVSALKTDVSELKENSKITRGCVNTLLDWAEKVQVQISIPLYQKEK